MRDLIAQIEAAFAAAEKWSALAPHDKYPLHVVPMHVEVGLPSSIGMEGPFILLGAYSPNADCVQHIILDMAEDPDAEEEDFSVTMVQLFSELGAHTPCELSDVNPKLERSDSRYRVKAVDYLSIAEGTALSANDDIRMVEFSTLHLGLVGVEDL